MECFYCGNPDPKSKQKRICMRCVDVIMSIEVDVIRQRLINFKPEAEDIEEYERAKEEYKVVAGKK